VVKMPEDPGEDAVTLFGQKGEIPEEDRDENVPAWMRAIVLARHGHRCGLCGSTEHLMAHHLRSLAKGGRTCFENLICLCILCHECVHSGTLIIRIRDGRVIGYNADGDEIRPPGDPAKVLIADQEHAFSAVVIKQSASVASDKKTELADRSAPRDPHAPPPLPPAVRLEDLPKDMTAAEFRKLQPLLDWDTSRKSFLLHPERQVCEPEESEGDPSSRNECKAQPEAGAKTDPAPAAPPASAPSASTPARAESPPRLADIVGQKETVEWLGICAKAASKTGEPMKHTLLTGSAGLGKTTIARLVANEMGAGFTEAAATTIRTPAHLLGMLVNLRPRDVLFVDLTG